MKILNCGNFTVQPSLKFWTTNIVGFRLPEDNQLEEILDILSTNEDNKMKDIRQILPNLSQPMKLLVFAYPLPEHGSGRVVNMANAVLLTPRSAMVVVPVTQSK
jgi:hypothetical protein